jgi:cyanophycinase
MRNTVVSLLLVMALATTGEAAKRQYAYLRAGNVSDVSAAISGGVVLMGGGADVDQAFEWMCARAGYGDFLIIRAEGTDAYNPYVQQVCPGVNSVATLIVPSADAANDSFVAATMRDAEAIFIAGGDQSTYVTEWAGTALQDELNAAIARGVPVGGTSAGMMALTQFVYAALASQGVASGQALTNPYSKYLTFDRDLASVPSLENTIGDSHFVARDRMGRTLAFMCRVAASGWTLAPRAIALDEATALLIDARGSASIVGPGTAYFLAADGPAEVCQPRTPLTYSSIAVYKVWNGGAFNLGNWHGNGGLSYALSATAGVLSSTQPGGSVY